MLKTKGSHTKTLAEVRAATLADVERLLTQPLVAGSAAKRIKKMRAAESAQLVYREDGFSGRGIYG
jgi:hypothetical protein